MGKIADSIKENLEHIEAAIADIDGVEFHADSYISLAENTCAAPTQEQEKALVINALIDNPCVEETECVPQFEQDPTAHKAPPPLTEKEADKQMKEMLKELGYKVPKSKAKKKAPSKAKKKAPKTRAKKKASKSK